MDRQVNKQVNSQGTDRQRGSYIERYIDLQVDVFSGVLKDVFEIDRPTWRYIYIDITRQININSKVYVNRWLQLERKQTKKDKKVYAKIS